MSLEVKASLWMGKYGKSHPYFINKCVNLYSLGNFSVWKYANAIVFKSTKRTWFTLEKYKAFHEITGNSLGHYWPIPFLFIKRIWELFWDCIDCVFKMTGDLQISSHTNVSSWSTELLVSDALRIEIDSDGQDLQLAI